MRDESQTSLARRINDNRVSISASERAHFAQPRVRSSSSSSRFSLEITPPHPTRKMTRKTFNSSLDCVDQSTLNAKSPLDCREMTASNSEACQISTHFRLYVHAPASWSLACGRMPVQFALENPCPFFLLLPSLLCILLENVTVVCNLCAPKSCTLVFPCILGPDFFYPQCSHAMGSLRASARSHSARPGFLLHPKSFERKHRRRENFLCPSFVLVSVLGFAYTWGSNCKIGILSLI